MSIIRPRALTLLLLGALILALLPTTTEAAPTGPLRLLSRSAVASGGQSGTVGPNGETTPSSISADGRYVVVSSEATDLVAGVIDDNGDQSDLYRYDTETGEAVLITHAFNVPMTTANVGTAGLPAMTPDGRYVVFLTNSTNLWTTQTFRDTNVSPDVIVWDAQTNTNTLVTAAGANTCGGAGTSGGSNASPSISDDGRYVAFSSTCANLLPAGTDTNGVEDVFLWDRTTGQSRLVSKNSAGGQHTVASRTPQISADGRFVGYATAWTASGAANTQLYRYSIAQDTNLLLTGTLGSLSSFSNGASTLGTISADGQSIAYTSTSFNLAPVSDTNGVQDVFLWTADPLGSRMVSQRSGGGDSANGSSIGPVISRDGSTIYYATTATNLVDVGTKASVLGDLVHHVVATGTDTLVTRNAAGTDGGNSISATGGPVVTTDGSEMLFTSRASDLALLDGQTDTDNLFDMFIYEHGVGVRLASVTPTNTSGNAVAFGGVLSSDGSTLAINSRATNLTDDTFQLEPNTTQHYNAAFVMDGEEGMGQGSVLSVADVEVTEGPAGSLTPMTFTVSLSVAATVEVTVDYATADVTTNFGPDYGRRDGTLVFAPGETTKTVEISVRGDDEAEETETFTFTLSNPTGGAELDPDATVAIGTILDDDGVARPFGSDVGVSDTVAIDDSLSNADTALALSQSTFADGDTPTTFAGDPAPGLPTATGALIATDAGFADALASGGLQASQPLLLTGTDELYDSVIAELDRLGVSTVTILGGEVAISATVEAELTGLGYAVTRYAGPSRLETATDAATRFHTGATTAVLARAFPAQGGPATQAFADSLGAGAFAAENGWPLIFTQTDVLSTSTRSYLETSGIQTVYVVGGEAAVSQSVLDALTELNITVIRLSGPSRFETALAIAEQRGFAGEADADSVMLLDGTADDAWAAGFAGAAHSAINGAPIVLAAAEVIPGVTETFLGAAPTFAVDETAVTDPVLICAIAQARCDDARLILGLPALAEIRLSDDDVARGGTFSAEIDLRVAGTINVVGPCIAPVSAMEGNPGTTTVAFQVPGEANQGPCDLAVTVQYANGSRQTARPPLTITP